MNTNVTRLLPLCTFLLSAAGLQTAAADQAGAPPIGISRDEMSFTVPFPSRRDFSGNGQVISLLLVGPVGDTRIINPGALFRARRYTACLLRPSIDSLEIIEIPRAD